MTEKVKEAKNGVKTMVSHRFLLFTLVLCALALGVNPGRAQSGQPAQSQGNANGQTKKVCKPGQMRCVDNNMRWDAAARNADRRADAMRKGKGPKK